MIHLTEAAALQVQDMMAQAPADERNLRMLVQGGGCSGLSYGMGFDQQKETDLVFEQHGVTVNSQCLVADSRSRIRMPSQHAVAGLRSGRQRMPGHRVAVNESNRGHRPRFFYCLQTGDLLH